MLCLTYPMIGNYGVPDEFKLDEHGIPLFFESSKVVLRTHVAPPSAFISSTSTCTGAIRCARLTLTYPVSIIPEQVHPAALIVTDLAENHSHWNAAESLSEYLDKVSVAAAIHPPSSRHLRAAATEPGSCRSTCFVA